MCIAAGGNAGAANFSTYFGCAADLSLSYEVVHASYQW
jgi:hypothetical protein